MQIESSQLETGAALKKIVIMALQVALTTMTLKMSLNNKQQLSAGITFTSSQIQFINVLLNTLEGKTQKQKSPYPKSTLAWAAWAIARLSGWSGYSSHEPPGYISIKLGLDIFLNKFEGYEMALNFLNTKDVYKE